MDLNSLTCKQSTDFKTDAISTSEQWRMSQLCHCLQWPDHHSHTKSARKEPREHTLQFSYYTSALGASNYLASKHIWVSASRISSPKNTLPEILILGLALVCSTAGCAVRATYARHQLLMKGPRLDVFLMICIKLLLRKMHRQTC